MAYYDDERTTSPMSWLGNQLDDWDDVYDENGNHDGTDHEVTGGTEHYNEAGEYIGFTDDEGNNYDASGNIIYDDDDD